MELVFEVLKQQHLYAKLSKCPFNKTEIDYLGLNISGKGVTTDPAKIQAVMCWPTPKSVKEFKRYYGKFVHNYGIISKPLTDTLKKDAFQWIDAAQYAFDNLRTIMSQAPVLALPDFSKPFTFEIDASGSRMEAVLQLKGHPIAYFSKAFGPKTKALSVC
ncbi:uncharacterized mitochondrial protein AtMg00860-like [Hevea brasiliensis]|uniref:uncharacterized mitochondrial protein AtMg00860-like n=1 Tax=Hevea brasiliensis TaxID=3981 RepID=UPI0025F936D0|nr:uncharacterized mitochondrial protein AtMg00860-like [Hevea brasiliensis]